MAADYDIFVIGGGINGCGIARDAAGRGYAVCLAEMNDFASGTSSWSTKLVHGGLRYLEHYEFRLVREALIERERLWANAPHIISPLRFVLPHHSGLRPAWLLRLGLFLYDNLGGRKRLPPTRVLDLKSDATGAPLQDTYVKGFEYSDCWVDDARLVALNARDAADRGADMCVRTKVVSADRLGDVWRIALEDAASGDKSTVTASVMVNAAGPWVDDVLRGALGQNDARNVRLVKGSHIVVPRLFEGDHCYIFQNSDERIVFAIPYEDDFTLIGTTDADHEGPAGEAEISQSEIDYLCAAVSRYFNNPVTPDQIVWTYSGVRPLYDDGVSKAQEATRDYVIEKDAGEGPALLNIFGGKITTYRKLAESMLDRIADEIGGRGEPWTQDAPLPGGDFPVDGRTDLIARLAKAYPWLDEPVIRRLARQQGTRAFDMLANASSLKDLGRDFGCGLYEREVLWLVETEWAHTADDVLWRRTKIGLRMTAVQIDALRAFLGGLADGSASAEGDEPRKRARRNAAA